MITKEKSEKMKQLKYLLIVPLLMAMLTYVSCTDDGQAEIEEMNNLIENEIIPHEGKYFEGKNGIKVFLGSYLEGEIVSFENMTTKEKEIFNNFNNLDDSKVEYSLIIDVNGDRVHFIKVPQPPIPMPPLDKLKDITGIPIAIIEEVPIFPGCEGSKEELRQCLQEQITMHVNRNFNTDLASTLKLTSGVNKIFVIFKIDKEGNITDVKSRAPHKALQEEAIRVVNLLPKMIPGKQEGENVGVKYSLPIAFKVE